MQPAMSRYPRRELAVLGLVETLLSFSAIYAMICGAGASAASPGLAAMLPGSGLGLAAILTIVTGAVRMKIGSYQTGAYLSRERVLLTSGLSVAVAGVILLAVRGDPLTGFCGAEALTIAELLGAWLTTMTAIRLLYGRAAARMSTARRILLVGDPRQNAIITARMKSRRGRGFHPVMLQAPDLSWTLLRQQRIWGVVLTQEPEQQTIMPLLDCKLRGMKILSSSAFQENYLHRMDLDALRGNDLLFGHGFAADRLGSAMKRCGDIVLGLSLLILTLPLMALTAVAIKVDSPGPVFYRQPRIGQFDRPFTLYKFRSMTVDAEAGGSPRWAQKRDPRVTRIGGLIRMTRIDELPQLANVIRGEMSLVGPRPERPHFVEQLAQVIPFYRQRAYVKPGLTGSAQVNYPYGASVEDAREKLAYDLYYVKNRSLLLDVAILISTIRVVLFREGAR